MPAPVVAAAIAGVARATTANAVMGAVSASVKTLKLSKKPRVTHWVPEYTAELEQEFQRRTKRAAEVVRDKVRKNIGRVFGGRPSKPGEYPKKRSGKLQKGVRTRMGRRSPYTFLVYSTTDYGDFLEYDVKGGKLIVPVTAKALRFTIGRGKGKTVVFAKKVRQGAIKGRSFMRRTLAENRKVIAAIYCRGFTGKTRGTLRIG